MALVFKLSGIDFKKLDEKYNLSLKPNLDVEEPEDNITKISDLNNNVKINTDFLWRSFPSLAYSFVSCISF